MDPKEDALAIFKAAVDRVNPETMIERAVSIKSGSEGETLVVRSLFEEARYELSRYDRVFATGMGKAAGAMARGLEKALGSRLSGGIVAVKEGQSAKLERIRLMEAGHPVPNELSIAAAQAILNLGASLGTALTERDLVVVLVSGGGSAILCAPAEGLSLADKAATTKLLLASGATIHEVNCLRKHLSAVKGGRLAAALAPASVLTLVLSDVVGDDLDAIASGPTVPDNTSFADALEIAKRYGIAESLPKPVKRRLAEGLAGKIADTPKPGDPVFDRARTILVGTNRMALDAACAEAEERGYHSLILSSRVTGEAREAALFYLGIGKDIAASDFPLEKPACLIAGGETTVTLRGAGKGGRNQEMALAFLAACARSSKDTERITFLSAGTDGNDGPTDAAGGLADRALLEKARELGLAAEAALADNDSYNFLSKAGGLVKTGPTGTNVCDVQVLIVTP